jgi:FtsH-binding integral membrane protein
MTTDREKHVAYLAFLLIVSVVGLVISTSLLRNPPFFFSAPDYRRILLTIVYDAVCISGMLAVLFPVTCSRALGAHLSSIESVQVLGIRATRLLGLTVIHGHHLSESELKKHELLVRGRSFCATCYGLLTGAVISLVIITAFTVSGWPGWIRIYSVYVAYYVGVAAVITGLLQPLITDVDAKTRFVSAFVFVVGTSLMLLATELLTANLLADLFVVCLAVFWLLSRISLSNRN